MVVCGPGNSRVTEWTLLPPSQPISPSLSFLPVKWDPQSAPRVLLVSGASGTDLSVSMRGPMGCSRNHTGSSHSSRVCWVPGTVLSTHHASHLACRCLCKAAILGSSVSQVVKAEAQRCEATCLESHSWARRRQLALMLSSLHAHAEAACMHTLLALARGSALSL